MKQGRPHQLTDRQILGIYRDGRSQYEIAEHYGCAQALVSMIKSKKHRVDVTKDEPPLFRRNYRSVNSGNKLFTDEEANFIMETDLSDGVLANHYGCHIRTIKRIKTGETYRG